jgi:hypothetical protein
MNPEATRYELGLGPFADFLVLLMLAGASAYFANAAILGETGPLMVQGRAFGGPHAVWYVFVAIAVLFGVAAIYLLVRTLQNHGRKRFVLVDANQLVVSGLDIDGGQKVVSHTEIVAIADYTSRGMAGVEISLRDGSKLHLGAPLFRSSKQYGAFRAQLQRYLPVTAVRGGLQMWLVAALLFALSSSPALAAPEDDGIRIGEVRAHLYYQNSGVLSEDLIARQPRFNGWNTDEGEGDAREPSRQLLVVATLVNPGEERFVGDSVVIRVTDEIHTVVRTMEHRNLRLPAGGTVHMPVWLDDAACLGTVTVTATFRDQTAKGTLDLVCGT